MPARSLALRVCTLAHSHTSGRFSPANKKYALSGRLGLSESAYPQEKQTRARNTAASSQRKRSQRQRPASALGSRAPAELPHLDLSATTPCAPLSAALALKDTWPLGPTHIERATFFAAAMTVMGSARARGAAANARAGSGAATEHNPRPDTRGSREKAPVEKADADDAITSSSTAACIPNRRIDDPAPIAAAVLITLSCSFPRRELLGNGRPQPLVNSELARTGRRTSPTEGEGALRRGAQDASCSRRAHGRRSARPPQSRGGQVVVARGCGAVGSGEDTSPRGSVDGWRGGGGEGTQEGARGGL